MIISIQKADESPWIFPRLDPTTPPPVALRLSDPRGRRWWSGPLVPRRSTVKWLGTPPRRMGNFPWRDTFRKIRIGKIRGLSSFWFQVAGQNLTHWPTPNTVFANKRPNFVRTIWIWPRALGSVLAANKWLPTKNAHMTIFGSKCCVFCFQLIFGGMLAYWAHFLRRVSTTNEWYSISWKTSHTKRCDPEHRSKEYTFVRYSYGQSQCLVAKSS